MNTPAPTTTGQGIAFEVFETPERMSQAAADAIVEAVRHAPALLWCTATGSTPIETYGLLAERQSAEPSLFQHARVLKLDEWSGLPMDDPATCEQYLRRHVLRPLDIPAARYAGFDSDPADPDAECLRIRRWLAAHGPIDLCLLGLGTNGHVGFNEPASSLAPFSHVAKLSASSRQHSMLDAAADPPRYGLTLGMAEILQAHQILLLVSGAHKQEALARLAQPQLSTQLPASLLWTHPNVRCLCDRAAAPPALSDPS